MKFGPDKINRILSHSRHLKKLISDSNEQLAILNHIKQLLNKQLAEHCLSASYDNNRLKLFTDSTIWASRLRFQSQSLKQQLQAFGLEVTQIDVRVSLDSLQKPLPRKKPARPVLSQSASQLLIDTADSIGTPELAAALKRLAGKTR